jgi:hypothetical protein
VFTNEVVATAISKLKRHKAAGPSFFTPELLKYFAKDEDNLFIACIVAMFNAFARNGIPLGWNVLHITSLYKSGDL